MSSAGGGERTPVDGVDVLYALSPSRASEFTSCPLLFRFRSVDRLPEPPSPQAVRGTLVHKVLEDLFELEAGERTPERAAAMLEPTWAALQADEPEAAAVLDDEALDEQEWLTSCHEVLARYFRLEDPRRVEPAERELFVEAVLDSGLLLRGVIDRVDAAPDGALRLSDYKTGKAPREGFEAAALFQLRFYALVLWRTRGTVPRSLRLLYLGGDGEAVTHEPDEDDLRATERKVEAIWRAIRYAEQTGDYRPRRSSRCSWCPHRSLCPAWGGTPPPLPGPRDA
ncbi:RecB family exonuclease [Nocardioides litoris]|uniref:RecB family exonuclease n=1 Tax=Nocardioides litoris TaxID=1926648 RepID=UPI0011224A6B|nr:PD-(D/E)XK nuclease family protein [Nocardioides litoris]